MRKLRLPTFVGIVTILCLSIAVSASERSESSTPLSVIFFDVGQGDATFIESPSGTQVLIDGGRDRTILSALGHELGFFDRDLDMVIATHPDLDHIGGLIDVFDQYEVHTILITENEGDTPAFEAFTDRILAEGAKVYIARSGQVYDLGLGPAGSTTLTILFPDRDARDFESNASSIIARLTYGESEYLFMGDAPQEIETHIMTLYPYGLTSDVLKVGHHGSRTSTSPVFVSAVEPSYAIISAGKDNSYGHPHKEVVDTLTHFNVTQKNTAEIGSIVSLSDGKEIWFK